MGSCWLQAEREVGRIVLHIHTIHTKPYYTTLSSAQAEREVAAAAEARLRVEATLREALEGAATLQVNGARCSKGRAGGECSPWGRGGAGFGERR